MRIISTFAAIAVASIFTLAKAQTSMPFSGFPPSVFKSVFTTPPIASTINLPIIELGSDQKIEVHFDDVQDRDLNLRYRIIHCNADATLSPSGLNELEYINGQNQVYVEGSELSMATRINYVHYSFSVPNNYQQLKLSGVYKVEIFESDSPSKILLSVPFLVCEPSVKIKATVGLPKRVEYRFLKQELSVELNLNGSNLKGVSPQQNIRLYALQNLNPKTARLLPLQYSAENTLFYKDSPEMVYDGLNEFRNFDLRPLTYAGKNVQRLEIGKEGAWHAFLYDQSSSYRSNYVDNDDINGRFVVKMNHSDASNIEADYAFVHFFLKEQFNPDAKIYVTGEFNRWQTDKNSLMTYNSDLNL